MTAMRVIAAITKRLRQSTTRKLTTGTASPDSGTPALGPARGSLISSLVWSVSRNDTTQLFDYRLRVPGRSQALKLGDFAGEPFGIGLYARSHSQDALGWYRLGRLVG